MLERACVRRLLPTGAGTQSRGDATERKRTCPSTTRSRHDPVSRTEVARGTQPKRVAARIATEPRLLEHVRVMNRYRWWVASIAVIASLTTFTFEAQHAPTFRASTVVRFVVPVINSGVSARESADLLARTYVETSSAISFATDVRTRGASSLSIEQIQSRLSIGTRSVPGFLSVTATGPSAFDAVTLANAGAVTLAAAIDADQQRTVDQVLAPLRAELTRLANALTATRLDEGTRRSLEDQRGALQRSIADRQERTRASVLPPDPAARPTHPIAPRPLRSALLALIIAVVGVTEGLVVVRTWRGLLSLGNPVGDLERLVGVPSLELGSVDRRRPPGAVLPFVLRHLSRQPVIAVIQCSGQPTALPATEVADALARVGRRVLLVDADVRSPMLHDEVGLPLSPGLVEVTSGAERLNHSVHRSPTGSGAVVLSAGVLAGRSAMSVLGSDSINAMVRGAGADTAVVLTTSAAPVEDALLVVHQFPEAVVLAVDALAACRDDIVDSVRTIRAVGGNLVGTMCVHPRPRLGWRRRRVVATAPDR